MKKFYLIIFLVTISICSCTDQKDTVNSYSTPPTLVDSLTLPVEGDTLRPVRVQYLSDTLFVTYNRSARIDLFGLDGLLLKSIGLKTPAPVYPTSFQVHDSIIFVTDHTRGMIARFDRDGNYINSFNMLPDSSTSLMPFALFYYGGVLYVSDIGQKKILAISMVDAKGITGLGELILPIPKDSSRFIDFPSAVYVTFEGRLITSDAKNGTIEVYTCDGQYIYNFDSLALEKTMTVQAIAIDHINDPELTALDSNSFDPSGIRNMGRIHFVDANNALVHMYNPLGDFIASYNVKQSLKKPSGISINYRDSLIYIPDPLANKIFILKY